MVAVGRPETEIAEGAKLGGELAMIEVTVEESADDLAAEERDGLLVIFGTNEQGRTNPFSLRREIATRRESRLVENGAQDEEGSRVGKRTDGVTA
jgi:hypothetical protein